MDPPVLERVRLPAKAFGPIGVRRRCGCKQPDKQQKELYPSSSHPGYQVEIRAQCSGNSGTGPLVHTKPSVYYSFAV